MLESAKEAFKEKNTGGVFLMLKILSTNVPQAVLNGRNCHVALCGLWLYLFIY